MKSYLSFLLIGVTIGYIEACANGDGVNLSVNGVSVNINCEDITCPAGYLKNPFSNTCLRLVTGNPKNWQSAKAYCETAGQYLAVVDGVDSVNWIEHVRRTNPAWKAAGWLWIAGKRVNGNWVWNGRITSPLKAADWEEPQPGGNGDCLQLFDAGRKYKWDDHVCSVVQNFVCELVP